MAVPERLLVDTNILLEATDERRSYHQEARAFIESYRGLVFPAQVLREYLVAATRPISSNGLGLALDHALANGRSQSQDDRVDQRRRFCTILTSGYGGHTAEGQRPAQ